MLIIGLATTKIGIALTCYDINEMTSPHHEQSLVVYYKSPNCMFNIYFRLNNQVDINGII